MPRGRSGSDIIKRKPKNQARVPSRSMATSRAPARSRPIARDTGDKDDQIAQLRAQLDALTTRKATLSNAMDDDDDNPFGDDDDDDDEAPAPKSRGLGGMSGGMSGGFGQPAPKRGSAKKSNLDDLNPFGEPDEPESPYQAPRTRARGDSMGRRTNTTQDSSPFSDFF